ncbi:biliverdin-producing heme oxygenase [Rubellimicrobium arenae]|uniref:biliverdin-producing heme oxygenase n=1 Tax=Rubellimicrobium arenae TaxID=2817372 RepID=UPI001B301229|nr:biliverdin-producing heme oxygenase [Rubellimicrobium arenae]
MGPLRTHLRSATRLAHERVDAAFGQYDLSRRSDYATFLSHHAAILTPLELSLEAAGVARLLPDWPERSRRHALRQDLEVLGLLPPSIGQGATPQGPAALLGMVYVLEGSRLGAAVLLRRVREATDPDVRAATLYLGHGAAQGLWTSFIDRLEQSPQALADPDAVVAGALAAFAAFEAAAGPAGRQKEGRTG